MSWLWIIVIGLAAFVALLGGPLLFGRMFMPGLTLNLVVRFGKWVAAVTDRIKPGLDTKLLVKATNRYFRRRFAATPYDQRVFFLPFCLRPADCPADIEPGQGLVCVGDCPGCELGRVRDEALSLGYAKVFIVPSSRMVRDRNLPPSTQFIKAKIKECAPCAALGVVCDWHLRKKLMADHKVDRHGLNAGNGRASGSVLQGVLLECRSCKQANVDWNEVRDYMRLSA